MKFIIYTLFIILCLACKNRDRGNISNQKMQESGKVNLFDTIPVGNAYRNIQPPFFKIFSGKVDNKELTLFLTKSNLPFDYYEGFYYYDDSKIVRKIKGYESVVIIDSAYNTSITGVVTELEMEKRWKSQKVIESFTLLNDRFSSIPYAEETYELNKFGFLGWFSEDSFKGYFSYPNFLEKTGKPSFGGDDGLDTINSNIIDLKYVQAPFEYVEERFNFFSKETMDSIKIIASLVLPKGLQLNNIRNQLLQKGLFFNNNLPDLKSILEKDAIIRLNKNEKIEPKKQYTQTNKSENFTQLEYKLRLNYIDDNILSFEYRITQRETLTRKIKTNIRFLNYDILENRFFDVMDIFKQNYTQIIKKAIESSKEMKSLKGNPKFAEGLTPLNPSDFFLSKKGVIFRFSPTIEYNHDIYIYIPYMDLNNCLTEIFRSKIKKWS